jgi:hypothetical protein
MLFVCLLNWFLLGFNRVLRKPGYGSAAHLPGDLGVGGPASARRQCCATFAPCRSDHIIVVATP